MVKELTSIAESIDQARMILIGVAGTLEQLAGIDSALIEEISLELMSKANKADL